MLTTTTAGGRDSDTILQGVVLLWSPTGWPLSLIVLFASIMIPSAKILALGYLLITVQRGSIKNNAQRVRLYRMVEFIGRWSMVDVFVDTFTAALDPAAAADVGGAGAGPVVLCGGGGADDARGRVLRSAADLGCSKLERGSTCLITTHRLPQVPESRAVAQEAHAALAGLGHPDRGGARRRLGRGDQDPERGAEDHDRLPVGRGTGGRQDQDPLQRRRHRHAHARSGCRTTTSA